MYLIGLTGGIASGKSTVARLLNTHGADTIDADQVARDVVLPGSQGLAEIVAEFGPEICNESGELNRERLGRIIFADSQSRKKLESILHPLIKQRTNELISASGKDVVVYSVPLLVEAKVDYPFDLVITVEAGLQNQLQRMIQSRGLTPEEAGQRLEAQATEAQRVERADLRLDSSGTLEQLAEQVAKLWPQIEKTSRASG